MSRRNIRVIGGADSPDVARDVQDAAAKEANRSPLAGTFGTLLGGLLVILFCTAAALAVVAAGWGLWLAARALFGAMGL